MDIKITKNTTLSQILEVPGAKEILLKYDLPCLGCSFAIFEMDSLKIGEICKSYNINAEKLIKELKEYASGSSKIKS